VISFFCAQVNGHSASLQVHASLQIHLQVMVCMEDFELVTSNGNYLNVLTSELLIMEKPVSN
jgi:hypothetical protein